MASLAPLPAFNFYIALVEPPGEGAESEYTAEDPRNNESSYVVGGFSECQGLESELSVEEFKAGGVNDRVFRFPGRANFPNITLTRGIGFGEELYAWHEAFLNGQGKRKNGLIFLANESRQPIKAWTFENGIPIKWSGPSLNATSSATAIEKLEIAHEKLSLTLTPSQSLDPSAEDTGA